MGVIRMSPAFLLLFSTVLLALTRGKTFLTKLEGLDLVEGLKTEYDEKLLTVQAELEAKYKEQIKTDVASEVSRLRDVPADDVLLCVYRDSWSTQGSTITYDRYLDTNYNNGERADMNLGTGVFTCLTPGFYTITYSGISGLQPAEETHIYLYLNGHRVAGSLLEQDMNPDTVGNYERLQGSRTLILNLDVNDTVEVRSDSVWFTGEIERFTLCLTK